ncbi:MAG TPA: ComEA family DNA-binding protein [Ktedonobacteraceae bacterium]|jgi:competence protein ComEA|nr:ComEA family DNA-binding protein [Ktedonobacteraceae bacterium]
MEPKTQFRNPGLAASQAQSLYQLSQQQTLPQVSITAPPTPMNSDEPHIDTSITPVQSMQKKKLSRIVAITLTLLLVMAIFFVWEDPSLLNTSTSSSQQNSVGIGSSAGANANSSTGSEDIQVYVTGAVKHPGVYILPGDARIFQLLQAAGGALPDANLVALNLAAKLSDGEEVYVVAIGEIPPSYVGGVPQPGASATPGAGSGQLVNINTASVDDLRTYLHVSSTTAQAIVNYRQQHGPYTSVDQLLQVISKSIYDRIKNMVTV